MATLREGPIAFPENKPPKIDHVHDIGKILPIDLNTHKPLVEEDYCRSLAESRGSMETSKEEQSEKWQ